MKKVLLFTPVVLAIAVLGAHYLRYDHQAGVIAACALLALLFLRRPWVARLTQVILVFGAFEWLRTLFMLAQMREAMGQPYLRMAVILGAVAAVTLAAALVFETRSLKSIYRRDG